MRTQLIREDYSEKTADFPYILRHITLNNTRATSFAVLPDGETETPAPLSDTEGVCPVTFHKNYEFLYFDEGKGTVLCNGISTAVTAGDVVAFNPNELHTVLSEAPLKYYSLVADVDFCRENGISSDTLSFRREKTCDEEIVRAFLSIAAAFCRKKTDALRLLAIHKTVLSTLFLLAEKHADPTPAAPDRGMELVKDAFRYIEEHLSERLTLDDISDNAGVSRFYFSALFRRKVGMSLFTYINLARCNRAKMLLSCGTGTVADACRQCGFDNLSYFSKTFKAYMGILPSEYRASCRPKKRAR